MPANTGKGVEPILASENRFDPFSPSYPTPRLWG
jgi:hypothetical protein